jgi:hypothetical protein
LCRPMVDHREHKSRAVQSWFARCLARALGQVCRRHEACLRIWSGARPPAASTVFLLLAETHLGDWHLARVRILDTFVGAGLAVLGAWFLWPVWERASYRKTLAADVAAQAQ